MNWTKEMPKRSHAVRNAALVLSILLMRAGSLFAWEFTQQPQRSGKYAVYSVRNYGVVWPGKLCRSGVAQGAAGWTWMHEQGVRSIVSFVKEDKVDYKRFGFENILLIPLSGQKVPTEEQAKQYLQFIQDPKNWLVDVHCHEGTGRTGMMVALARYAIDGWPMEQALAEAKTYRGGEDLPKFRVEWLRKWAAEHKPGSERRPDTTTASNTHKQ